MTDECRFADGSTSGDKGLWLPGANCPGNTEVRIEPPIDTKETQGAVPGQSEWRRGPRLCRTLCGRDARILIPRWRWWSVSARLQAGSHPAGVNPNGKAQEGARRPPGNAGVPPATLFLAEGHEPSAQRCGQAACRRREPQRQGPRRRTAPTRERGRPARNLIPGWRSRTASATLRAGSLPPA